MVGLTVKDDHELRRDNYPQRQPASAIRMGVDFTVC